MRIEPIVPAPFSPLVEPAERRARKFVESSGRSSGKSTTNETIAVATMLQSKYNNIWYCRAEANDVRKSIFSSMISTIDFYGLTDYFYFTVNPPEITCKVTGAKCYFGHVNGKTSDDLNATKGFNPQFKTLAMFILDEANEVKSPQHVKAAETTANKFLIDGGFIVYAYNPPPVRTHWAHRYFGDMVNHGAVSIYSTYNDIRTLLKPTTLEEIEEMRITNHRQYEYWYLGRMVSLEGLVLYTYNKERNLVPFDEFRKRCSFGGQGVMYIIYGVDSGVVKDPTAVCAWGVMSDGTLLLLGTCYIDPKKEGQPIPNSMQVDRIGEWYQRFYEFYKANGIILPGAYNECWVFDSAVVTQDLMFELQNRTGFHCLAVENKNIDRDIKRLQNGFFRGIFKVLDIKMNDDFLREIGTFCYDENNKIPDGQDDHTIDATKYATAHYYYGYMALTR